MDTPKRFDGTVRDLERFLDEIRHKLYNFQSESVPKMNTAKRMRDQIDSVFSIKVFFNKEMTIDEVIEYLLQEVLFVNTKLLEYDNVINNAEGEISKILACFESLQEYGYDYILDSNYLFTVMFYKKAGKYINLDEKYKSKKLSLYDYEEAKFEEAILKAYEKYLSSIDTTNKNLNSDWLDIIDKYSYAKRILLNYKEAIFCLMSIIDNPNSYFSKILDEN